MMKWEFYLFWKVVFGPRTGRDYPFSMLLIYNLRS